MKAASKVCPHPWRSSIAHTSRRSALQALLDSLAPGAEARGEDRLKADQVRKISDKLGELLGDDVIPDMGQRNAKGEVCPSHCTFELFRTAIDFVAG